MGRLRRPDVGASIEFILRWFSTTICVESGGTNDSRWSKSPTKTDTDNSNETNCTWGNAAQATDERKLLQHYILHVNLRYRLEKN
ncbi:unnamed protein product [Phytophthora lilii]|uniref:Unnamed protein product n=1 Tax=Phytophthora lilii TaxID=2077276 RepID=A0A9W6WWV2_9STRA|nr:unnamed protein product [Phytophthora lilii]